MTVWIDGRKFTGLTAIYNELGAYTPEAMKEARSCLEAGRPYKGHCVELAAPGKKREAALIPPLLFEPGDRPARWG